MIHATPGNMDRVSYETYESPVYDDMDLNQPEKKVTNSYCGIHKRHIFNNNSLDLIFGMSLILCKQRQQLKEKIFLLKDKYIPQS